MVYAEPYQGHGPGKDEAILATQAGAQITDSTMPTTFSTNEPAMPPGVGGSPNGSSTTATSATATARQEPRVQQNGESPSSTSTLASPTATSRHSAPQDMAASSAVIGPGTQSLRLRPRITGATPIAVLPASSAILPKQPKQSWSQWLGTGEVIGSAVPKKEDGSFDYERASMYWRLFWWLDSWLGTDFCGMRGD